MNRTSFIKGIKKPIMPAPGQRWFWSMSEEEFKYPTDPEKARIMKRAHETWRKRGQLIIEDLGEQWLVVGVPGHPKSRPKPIPKNVFSRLYQFGHYESIQSSYATLEDR